MWDFLFNSTATVVIFVLNKVTKALLFVLFYHLLEYTLAVNIIFIDLYLQVMCPPGSISLSPDSGCIFPYYLPDDDARLETQNKSAQEYCDSLSSHIPIINTPEDANDMIRELRSLMVSTFLIFQNCHQTFIF